MTKRFRSGKSILADYPTGAIIDEKTKNRYYDGIKPSYISSKEIVEILNQYEEENEQLKQYKQSVGDVLIDWSQKNLTAKQLAVVVAIMKELNVGGDVE